MMLFHCHKFDPEKWKLISKVGVMKRIFTKGTLQSQDLAQAKEHVYRNTCLDCGDLIFRRVREME